MVPKLLQHMVHQLMNLGLYAVERYFRRGEPSIKQEGLTTPTFTV